MKGLSYSIGEESYSSGTRPPLTDTPTFCVDPIGTFSSSGYSPAPPRLTKTFPATGDWKSDTRRTDGTTNFVHGFPFACISLGLLDQRVPVLGVIYNPFLEHLYTGVRGAGSFLHAHAHTRASPPTSTTDNTDKTTAQRLPLAPASARPPPTLANALIAVEWGSDRAREPIRRKADSFSRLAGAPPYGVMAHSLRSVGSAALNFALVAQGALDMYWCVCRRFVSFSVGLGSSRGANSAFNLFLFCFFRGCREIGCWCVFVLALSALSITRPQGHGMSAYVVDFYHTNLF